MFHEICQYHSHFHYQEYYSSIRFVPKTSVKPSFDYFCVSTFQMLPMESCSSTLVVQFDAKLFIVINSVHVVYYTGGSVFLIVCRVSCRCFGLNLCHRIWDFALFFDNLLNTMSVPSLLISLSSPVLLGRYSVEVQMFDFRY